MPNLRLALLLCLFAPVALHAQAAPAGAATTSDDGPPGIVPVHKGYNVSLNVSSEHDSSNGWSSVFTPNAAYRFNDHFSLDTGAPIYDYINVEQTSSTTNKGSTSTTNTYSTKHFVAGDTALNGHFQASPNLFDYELTATLGLPSGNTSYGLGAGKVTYQFNNSFEHSFGIFSPSVEIGIGDSSALEQTRIRKSFTTVGTLANFQAGASVDLPHSVSFSASAYENLPLSSQTLYSTTGRGKKKVTTAIGKSNAEDNGFLTSLDIPVSGHVVVSGFYNRSLRNHIDTAGFSLLFLLKARPKDTVH